MKESISKEKVVEYLRQTEFVYMSTCADDMQPNVSPKAVLKVEDNYMYLGDYNIDRTWANLNSNPKASVSIIDCETLIGYQVNGTVELIDKGNTQSRLSNEFKQRSIHFTVKRVIDGIHKRKTHKSFEASFPDRVIVYKMKMDEIIRIQPGGKLERQKL